jgi:hypothetical protein
VIYEDGLLGMAPIQVSKMQDWRLSNDEGLPQLSKNSRGQGSNGDLIIIQKVSQMGDPLIISPKAFVKYLLEISLV